MFPTVVRYHAERDIHKWPPLRPLRFSNQMHARLNRCAVGLARVAPDAGADNVFPGRGAAVVAWDDVVEIEIAAVEVLAAILAGVAVALEDVMPGEFDFLVREPIEEQQQNHPRDANVKGDGPDHVFAVMAMGKFAPLVEIKRLEITGIFDHDFGVAHVQQHKRALNRADVDRLPQAVEYKHTLIERVSHTTRKRLP